MQVIYISSKIFMLIYQKVNDEWKGDRTQTSFITPMCSHWFIYLFRVSVCMRFYYSVHALHCSVFNTVHLAPSPWSIISLYKHSRFNRLSWLSNVISHGRPHHSVMGFLSIIPVILVLTGLNGPVIRAAIPFPSMLFDVSSFFSFSFFNGGIPCVKERLKKCPWSNQKGGWWTCATFVVSTK